MEVEPQEGELGALVSSPEFARMVDRFAATTGLQLQVFDLDAHPLTAVEDYPRYCRLLQERKACPLYNDPAFLKRGEETIGVCKSGVGHFIAPVGNEKEVQIGAVVSPAIRFGPNSVEEFAELAFQLKIFPDDLIQAADAVQEHDAENLLGAGELVSVGLNLLAEMQAKERVGHALRRLQAEIAESNAQMLTQHVVDALLYLTRADYALVLMIDDSGSDLASAFDQPAPDQLVAAKRRLVEGIAEWVKHADRTVTVPDISKSAWSRYLTDDTVKAGSVVGVPIPDQKGGSTFGAIVVGFDRARDDLEEPLAALESFVAEGLYALVMGRKLMQAEQLAHPETISLPLTIKPNPRNALPLWIGLVACAGLAVYPIIQFRLTGAAVLIPVAAAAGLAIATLWFRRRYFSRTSLFVDQREAGLIPAFGRRKAVSSAAIRNRSLCPPRA